MEILVSKPRVITIDKNPAYPIAIEQLKKENILRLVVQTKALVHTTIIYSRSKERVMGALGF